MAQKIRRTTLARLVGDEGLFVDGDWVESKDQDPNGDVRLIQLADVGDGFFVNKSARFLTSDKARELGCTFLKPNDVLVARMPDPIGRACIFPGDSRPCVTVVDVCVIRPGAEIDRRWLVSAINSPAIRSQLEKHVKGSTRQRISRTNLGTVEVDLPPLPEQQRIADILDKARELYRKRRQALLLCEELFRSSFLEIYGDPATNSKNWPIKQLGQFITFITSGSRGWAEHYSVTGARFIRSLDVQMDYISDEDPAYVVAPASAEAKRTRVQPDDVLLTITGSKIGRAARVTKDHADAYVSQHVSLLRLGPGLDADFLTAFLISERGGQALIAQSQYGQTKPGLNLTQIRSFPIPVPPEDVQMKIRHIRNKLHEVKKQHKEACLSADILLSSLMQRAFSGSLSA